VTEKKVVQKGRVEFDESGKNIFGGEGISFDIEIREFKLNRIKK